ncbi:MAG: LCP family protein [Actinobacteria bacterium]|nr:LCP family protein [Actinomycetota bacterium]
MIWKRRNRKLYLDGDRPRIHRGRKSRWKTVLKWGSLGLAVLLFTLFVVTFIWLKSKESRMKISGVEDTLDNRKKGEPVNTLVLGVDRGSVPGEDEEACRSDIMMLVSVDSSSGKAAVISIPRDTRVTVPGKDGYQKINAAHAIGGPELAIKTVKEFTGLDINHYAIIDFEGFRHIVDAIGGVPMHIDVAIHDKYAGDLEAGDRLLDGNMALTLVRARHDVDAVPAGDLSRVQNQRKFIQAMLSELAGERSPFKIKKIIDAASENVKTDLSFLEMLSLGRQLRGGEDRVQMATVPGEPKTISGGWYYIVDEAAFKQLLADFRSKTEVEGHEAEKDDNASLLRGEINLAVLNGSGVSRLASSIAEELQKIGYSRIETGNSKSLYNKTTIYYSGTDSSKAGLVAGDLGGIEEPKLESGNALTADYGVDVLVVLGKDYEPPGDL